MERPFSNDTLPNVLVTCCCHLDSLPAIWIRRFGIAAGLGIARNLAGIGVLSGRPVFVQNGVRLAAALLTVCFAAARTPKSVELLKG